MLAADLSYALDPAVFMRDCGINPDPWQADLLRSGASQSLLLCSRQSGKSTVSAVMAVNEALYSPPALVLLLSPSQRQSQELFRKVMDIYRRIETVPADQQSAHRLELPNGSRIVSLPGTGDTVRGFSAVRLLIIDEAAFVEDDLYHAVRPMLAVSKGRLVAMTTPHGKRGFFYDAWTSQNEWNRITIKADQCPRITREFLEQERRALGDWKFQQEYECEFVDTEDQAFVTDQVRAAITPDVTPLFSEPMSW